MNQFVNCGFSVQGFFDHDFFGSGLGAEHRSKNAGIKVSYDRSSIEAVVEDYFADLP